MMGKQNIAIRGHQDEDSNLWRCCLYWRKKTQFCVTTQKTPRISKYTCPDIQNEIIFFPEKQIFDGIIDNCKRSVIYVDETTDVTNKEQNFICIRFVGRKEDGKHLIREEFLTFLHAGKGTNVSSSSSSSLYFLTR